MYAFENTHSIAAHHIISVKYFSFPPFVFFWGEGGGGGLGGGVAVTPVYMYTNTLRKIKYIATH